MTVPRLLLITNEPVLHELLRARLTGVFEVSGTPSSHAQSLSAARGADVDITLVDADGWDADPADVVAGLVLVGSTPVVVLSSIGAIGSSAAAALFSAGAEAVLHKPAGRLPLDLNGPFGDALVARLQQGGRP
jgi:DNA-binding NarL/FixJ family response regulator